LALGFFCANSINSFFMGWFPSYLMHERGFTLQQVATIGVLPAVSALAGGLLGGVVADWLYRWGFSINASRKTCLVGGLVASSLVAIAVLVPNLGVAFVLFSLSYAGIAFTSANIQSVPMEVSPSKAEVASVTAISTVGGAFAGLVGNWLVGVFIQVAGGSYVATIVGVGIFALIAALIYLFVVGPIRPLTRAELGLPKAADGGASPVANVA
jgi:MFS family permease